MPRVVVVGAGISGLAAAYRITELDPSIEVRVLERGTRVGGSIATECVDGFVVDRGPESILTDKPAAMRLVERLGLASRIVRTDPAQRGAYVVRDGRLVRVPSGFSLLAPTEALPFLASPVLSLRGRLRALAEVLLPRGPTLDDESLASFVERRFGRELLERLAQPMVSGIYGASPETLSLRATMPRFLDAEREHGSVIRGLRERAKASDAAAGARYGLFVNFDAGMQVLTDAMAAHLGERIELAAGTRSLAREGAGFSVERDDGTRERADAVILALPAYRSAELASSLHAKLASSLATIDYGSAAIVTFAFPRASLGRPIDAYGYVTPVIEGRRVIASTWSSAKWPGRAPSSHVLVRFFLGRDGDDAIVSAPDDVLLGIARDEALRMLGARTEPELARIDRFVRAMPRYRVGHLARVAEIEAHEAAVPRFALAGAAYRGVGIPDTIASGESAAERIVAALRG